MPRNRLEPGTFGLVTVRRVDAGRWRASCQLRDFDGDLRYINRVASTRGRAEAAAQEAAVSMRDALVRDHEGAQERRRDAERGILPRDTDPTTVRELTIAWQQSLGENGTAARIGDN